MCGASALFFKNREKIAQYGLANFAGQEYVKDAQIQFPWERMFEADIVFPKEEIKTEK